MRIAGVGAHLTYCTNIHPGESWAEVRTALDTLVPAVKARISPDAEFGVGLRLSARAASELTDPDALAELRDVLSRRGLYVFTLNGFPYGQFHGSVVKERVYRPDWLEPERLSYTRTLAHLLSSLLPSGVEGSISTVPGAFAPRAVEPGARLRIADGIAFAAAELVRLEREQGRTLALALEPEPSCLLESSADAVRFIESELLRGVVLARFAQSVGLSESAAEAALRRHVGVCLDACHASVEFETPLEARRTLRRAGIRVPKIQISAGLVMIRADAERLAALASFADPTYLHQVVVRSGETFFRFLDLGEALSAADRLPPRAEWRVHFHVPVFERALEPFTSTQDELADLLATPDGVEGVPHLEVETYTWDVLPARYRALSVDHAIARELEWSIARLMGGV